MPARSTRIPSYRHYRPKDLAVVRIDGRDHYLGKYDSPESRQRYHRLIAEWLASADRSPATADPAQARPAPPLEIKDLILAYWRHAELHYRGPGGEPAQELENMRDAIRPLRQLYGDTDVARFGPLCLRAVRAAMVRRGLSRTTINARVNRIRRVFKWGVGVELVPPSVYQSLQCVEALKRGRTEAAEPEGVTPVDVANVEATLPFLPAAVAAMVQIQLLTGCRTEEVLSMRGCDLSPGEPNWEFRPASHKNRWRGKGRVIPLGPRARAIVKDFLREDPAEYLFSPAATVRAMHEGRGRARKSRRTPSELARRCDAPGEGHGARYSRRSYRQAIVRACDKAFPHPTLAAIPRRRLTQAQRAELDAWRKARRWTPLQLRHAAATLIRARFGLESAQAVLGHARADVTQLYAERDLDKAHTVMAAIG
jgi:integrase